MDIAATKQTLAAEGLVPSKSLGQNFLVNKAVIEAILDGAEVDGARVLEVGPGLGALTRGLVRRALCVVAVEKDKKLAGALRTAIPDEKLTVVAMDFLDVDIPRLIGKAPFDAVGNLPYYVTTPIVEKLLGAAPRTMTLMVQREAAERFSAMPGSRVYGPVAAATGVLYAVSTLLDVPPDAFYPAPEVESRVVRLVRKAETDGIDGKGYLTFLKRAFAMRRKTLRNVLQRESGFDRAAERLYLPAGVRAEALSPDVLYALYRMMKEDPS